MMIRHARRRLRRSQRIGFLVFTAVCLAGGAAVHASAPSPHSRAHWYYYTEVGANGCSRAEGCDGREPQHNASGWLHHETHCENCTEAGDMIDVHYDGPRSAAHPMLYFAVGSTLSNMFGQVGWELGGRAATFVVSEVIAWGIEGSALTVTTTVVASSGPWVGMAVVGLVSAAL